MAELNTTYKDIVEQFEAAATSHLGVNQFATGTLDYLNATTVDKAYPYVFLRPLSSTGIDITARTKVLTFELYSLDVPTLENESPVSLLSKTERVLSDIMAWFNRGYEQQKYELTMTSLVPVNEAFQDRTFGWVATIDVTVPFVLDFCNYPKLP